MATFGERLKALREEKGIKQNQLAAMLGVSNVTVNRWEHGNQNLDESSALENLETLTEIFDVSLSYLIGASDDSKPPETVDEEFLAESALQDEMEHNTRMMKMLTDLSPEMRKVVEGTLALAYKADKQQGRLNSQRDKDS